MFLCRQRGVIIVSAGGSSELLNPLIRADDVCRRIPNFSLTTTTSPLRHEPVVDQHLHRLTRELREFDDRSLPQLEATHESTFWSIRSAP